MGAEPDERLKESGGGNYFDELLSRIRYIRVLSENVPVGTGEGHPFSWPQTYVSDESCQWLWNGYGMDMPQVQKVAGHQATSSCPCRLCDWG